MKRIKFLAVCLAVLAGCGLLGGCNSDFSEAVELSGEWQGDFGSYYEYAERGRLYTFDSYDSHVVFYPDYEFATHGYGRQVDYYPYGPYECLYYRFEWSVRNGVLYMIYPGARDMDKQISSYHLSYSRFWGRMSGSGIEFSLRKVADFYDWSPYSNVYGYYDRYDWFDMYPYYVPSRADAQADSAPGVIVRRGNRLQERADVENQNGKKMGGDGV